MSSTQPTSVVIRGVVERPVQLVDGVRAERVADLGPVERDAHRAGVDGAVVGDVGELESRDRHATPTGSKISETPFEWRFVMAP